MKLLRVVCAVAFVGSPALASPLSTCAEFLTLEPFHREQIRVNTATGHILYASDVSTPQLARYMAVFGWVQGQIEADVWFTNGQNMQVGLRDAKVQVEGTTYDHMTWAFAYCRDYPDARMPLVVNEVFNFFVKK